MQKIDESNLESVIHEFLEAFKSALEWKWDNRFETALSEFAIADQDNIKEILSAYFGQPWDTNNIIGAPTQIKTIDYSFGSLMYGQQLLTSDPGGQFILYCMWWPWGNGERVSIRVGIYWGDQEEDDKEASSQKLRALFGLS